MRDNQMVWLITAIMAFMAMYVLCVLAAFAAGWVSGRHRDGVTATLVAAANGLIAALVAAVVSGTLYVGVTHLAGSTSPAPDITQSYEPCAPIFGLALVAFTVVLAPFGAGLGAWAG